MSKFNLPRGVILAALASTALTACAGGPVSDRGLLGPPLEQRDYPIVVQAGTPITAALLNWYEQTKSSCVRVVKKTSPGPARAGAAGVIRGGIEGTAGGALGAAGFNSLSHGQLEIGPSALYYGGASAIIEGGESANYERILQDSEVRLCLRDGAYGFVWIDSKEAKAALGGGKSGEHWTPVAPAMPGAQPTNADILRTLESISHRLDALEAKPSASQH